MRMYPILTAFLLFQSCQNAPTHTDMALGSSCIRKEGHTLETRIATPDGYTRMASEKGDFTSYLRSLEVWPDSTQVVDYTGDPIGFDVNACVIKMDIGHRDLQQCADACIRMRAEYLWSQKKYDQIQFHLTNGFLMEYDRWREGNRLQVHGNTTTWVKSASPDTSYASFRKYLDQVFTYAGTISVSKELKPVALKDLQPGDVFVVGGSPGHASMVADVAINEKGEKIFLLLQGYMPAQSIHIIKHPEHEESPWYALKVGEPLETTQWRFDQYILGRFE